MTEQQACTLCGAGGHTAAQCNWNQGSADFQREERYVVAKISKMHPHPTFRRRHLESLKRELAGVLVDCVVVERDWPEYETVWRMIEARVTGQAGSMVECPHRCGSMFAKESYGAGFIEGSGMCPACDAAMPANDIVSPGEEPTPPELLAAKLIDTWRTVHGRPVPWEKAVEITAIATSMSNEERERLLAMGDAPVAQAGQVPDGWRVMRCTSSVPRDGDKWEIYDPQGSGGVVSIHDVKDWAVRGLLDALADAPAKRMPTEAELEAAGLGYPLSKEQAVALWNDRTVVAPGGE